MTSHRLQELRHLLRFSVVSENESLGNLTGFMFDPVDWTIRSAVVADSAADREAVLVPIGCLRAISEDRRELRFDVAGEVLLSAAGLRAGGLGQPALKNAAELLGRAVAGFDDVAGRLEDLLVNVEARRLRYLVVRTDTGRVLTDVEWCSSVGDEHQSLSLDLPAAAVTGAPSYEGIEALCIGDEEALYRHYTSRKYVGDGGVA